MSYATPRLLGGHASIGVGKRAASDPILARASLDASSILLAMAKSPPASRLAVMQNGLDRLGVEAQPVVAEMKRGLVPGANPDQVTFDAMRLAIANTRFERGIDSWKHEIASRSGWDSLVDAGLGLSANDRATGCMIAGGANVVGGVASIVPGYGTLIGGVIGIGSSIAGNQLDCGKEARDAAVATALAQQQLDRANAIAAQQAATSAAASRQHRFQTVAVGGAILLAVLGAAWVVLD